MTHHVTIRGIEGRDIFDDAFDRNQFLDRLASEQAAAGFTCLAWALMSNHVHIVVRTGAVPLSTFMQRLNGGYAIAFNRRHARTGYLLQDRFHSSVIGDDAYRSVAVRYVFLNPVRAGVVPSVAALESYPWTGYSELTGKHPRGIIAVAEILEWLEMPCRRGGSTLRQWLAALEDSDLKLGREAGRPRPGSLADEIPREVRAARNLARGWTLDGLVAWTAQICGVSEAAVRGGRRSAAEARARAIIATLAADELGIDKTAVAAATGVSLAAISRACRRGDQIVLAEAIQLPFAPAPREKSQEVKKSTPAPLV